MSLKENDTYNESLEEARMNIQDQQKERITDETIFDNKHGIVGKPDQWETPHFVKDFFSFIVGQPQVQQPKVRKVNILSK